MKTRIIKTLSVLVVTLGSPVVVVVLAAIYIIRGTPITYLVEKYFKWLGVDR